MNAIEAVSGQPDAWVEIEYHELGDNCTLVVRNSGPKIPSEIADRMFEPSFTTKGYGRGAGLGLSVASDLIRGHGGELVYNAKSKFTSFEIRMPKAKTSQNKNDSQSEAA